MAYKVKDEYKDYKPINMNISYGELLPHQIDSLCEEVKKKYFTNTTKSKKKKKVVQDDLDFIGGHNA